MREKKVSSPSLRNLQKSSLSPNQLERDLYSRVKKVIDETKDRLEFDLRPASKKIEVSAFKQCLIKWGRPLNNARMLNDVHSCYIQILFNIKFFEFNSFGNRTLETLMPLCSQEKQVFFFCTVRIGSDGLGQNGKGEREPKGLIMDMEEIRSGGKVGSSGS